MEAVLGSLTEEGLLSDMRFAETFVNSRVDRGYGPVRIRHELHQNGLDEGLIKTCLREYSGVWLEHARAVRRRRFGDGSPADFKERARQARFLAYRGFTQEHIDSALEDCDGD